MTSSDQSSSEVEHEAEDTRAGLASTLDQLRDNLKPENVMDEVLTNAKIGASTVMDGAWQIARENPVPALLIAAGAAMLMGFGARSAVRSSAGSDYTPDGSLPRPRQLRGPTMLESAKAGLSSIMGGAASSTATLGQRSAGLNPPPPRGIGVDQQPTRNFGGLKMTARDRFYDSATSTQSRLPNASQLTDLFKDQPLILGALGIAVGAAIGAALPTTDTEDQLLGSTSHSLRQAAQDVAQHQVEEIKAVAGRAMDNVKQSASEHGLSADNLGELVKDVGAHAKTAVHEVTQGLDASKEAGPKPA